MHLVYDRKVVDRELFAAVDSPLQFVFDRTSSCGLDGQQQCLAVSLSAATRWIAAPADARLIAMATGEIARLFSDAAAGRVIDGVVIRERAATFAGRPGTAKLRPTSHARRRALPRRSMDRHRLAGDDGGRRTQRYRRRRCHLERLRQSLGSRFRV